MNKPDTALIKQKNRYQGVDQEKRIIEKYKTDFVIRPKYGRELIKKLNKATYNTTPGDKYTCRHVCDKERQFIDNGRQLIDKERQYNEDSRQHRDKLRNIFERRNQSANTCYSPPNSQYLKNNLSIKSGIVNQDPLQLKRVSIRNYRPKILVQEISLGMWI